MKNIFIKAMAGVMLTVSATACGDKFLDTEISNGIDTSEALTTPYKVGVALNGTYYRLCQYYFAGNFMTTFGDIGSDILYWNQQSSHQNALYCFNYQDTYYGFEYVWEYGYKVIDNSARVLEACDLLLPDADSGDIADLHRYKAEAYALRAYAMFNLVNVFGPQVKVNGTVDNSDRPGVVIVDKPIPDEVKVSRSTVGQCYDQILSDINNSITEFNTAGEDAGEDVYFTPKAVYGLMARVKLYLEDWQGAYDAASQALAMAKITKLAYANETMLNSPDPKDQAKAFDDYKALYSSQYSNNESMFYLALDEKVNWSANSCGTLFSTYSYGPSPYLISLYGDNDCRPSIFYWTNKGGDAYAEYGSSVPYFGGAKFGTGDFNGVEGGNPAVQTNYLINAPEMFLIQAEAKAQLGAVTDAADALFVVAHRNPAIASTADLPADKAGILDFIKDERARELFQEGHRFWDLRRWDATTNLYAYGAPDIKFAISNVKVSGVVFPIPADEINAKWGVEQTPDWAATRPQ